METPKSAKTGSHREHRGHAKKRKKGFAQKAQRAQRARSARWERQSLDWHNLWKIKEGFARRVRRKDANIESGSSIHYLKPTDHPRNIK